MGGVSPPSVYLSSFSVCHTSLYRGETILSPFIFSVLGPCIWGVGESTVSLHFPYVIGPCIGGESMDIDENDLLAVGSWRRYDNVEIFDFGTGERIASIDQTPSM